jgi:hypothetical protein
MSADRQALHDFVALEQVSLWSDLDHAIRYAINGVWSMDAANCCVRIVSAARLVGVTPTDEIQYGLLAGGVYQTLCEIAGLEHTMPTEHQWIRYDEVMAQHAGTREQLIPRFAATVAAMREEREAAYIREGLT